MRTAETEVKRVVYKIKLTNYIKLLSFSTEIKGIDQSSIVQRLSQEFVETLNKHYSADPVLNVLRDFSGKTLYSLYTNFSCETS